MHCVDLGDEYLLANLASIQRRTSLVKFARSPRTDPPGSDRISGERQDHLAQPHLVSDPWQEVGGYRERVRESQLRLLFLYSYRLSVGDGSRYG